MTSPDTDPDHWMHVREVDEEPAHQPVEFHPKWNREEPLNAGIEQHFIEGLEPVKEEGGDG